MRDTESVNLLLRHRIDRSFCGRALLASLLLATTQALVVDEHKIDCFSGAKLTTHPAWFKESFLDFEKLLRSQEIVKASDLGS